MKKILLAIGSEAAEARLMQNKVLSQKYRFTNIATHKESIVPIAKTEQPDIILLKESLPGTIEITDLIFSIRSEVPLARIIFMTSSRPVGDPLMSLLVSCGIYDILATASFSLNSIVEIIENPKTFADVSSYIAGVNIKEQNAPINKDVVQKGPSIHKMKAESVIQEEKPKEKPKPAEYGKLKIEGETGAENIDYSPILTVNKSNFGNSFKPNFVKPDISGVDEIIFDDEQPEKLVSKAPKEVKKEIEKKDVLVEQKHATSKQEQQTVPPLNKQLQQDEEEIIVPLYKKPSSSSFIAGRKDLSKKQPLQNPDLKQVKKEPLKTETEDLVKKPEPIKLSISKPVEEKEEKLEVEVISFNGTKIKTQNENNEPKVNSETEIIKNKPETSIKEETEEKHEEKTMENASKKEKIVFSLIEKKKDDNIKETEEIQAEKNTTEIKIDMRRGKVYTFIHDDIYSTDHTPLNVSLILSKLGGKILHITLKQSGIHYMNDVLLNQEWTKNYPNVKFCNDTAFTLLHRLDKKGEYTHVIIDVYQSKELNSIINEVSDKVIHIIRQSPLLINDLKKDVEIRKDIAVIPEYRPDILSYKAVIKEEMFGSVVRVGTTELEDYNALSTKLPLMARKNNQKTIKDYNELMLKLEGADIDE